MPENYLLICSHCQTQNKVPSSRLNDEPKCGKCHQQLFAKQPIELDAGSFERHLTKSDIPLLVDFWAPWCGPCKMMAPHFEKAATLLEPNVRLAKINTEVEQGIAMKYNVRSIPTMKLFKNAKEVASQAGAMQTQDIVRWVQSYL